MTRDELDAVPAARADLAAATMTEQDGEVELVELAVVVPVEALDDALADPAAAAELVAWIASRGTE